MSIFLAYVGWECIDTAIALEPGDVFRIMQSGTYSTGVFISRPPIKKKKTAPFLCNPHATGAYYIE